jgi:WD40 repeat protein
LGASGFSGSRLEELAALPKLTNLNLQPNIRPEFLVKLEKVPSVSGLGFGSVRDEHLAEIASLSHITNLHISHASPTGKGLKTLGRLGSLLSLTVANIELDEEHLDALATLKQLDALHLAEAGVGRDELQMLEEALPDCSIRVTPPLETQPPGANVEQTTAEGLQGMGPPSIIPRPAGFPGIDRWRVEPRFPRGSVMVVDVSPDDRWIACGTQFGNVQIFDAETLQMVEILSGHVEHVRALAWSPDGERLASGGSDGSVRLWDTADWRSQVVAKQTGVVSSVAWSPDGKKLAFGGSAHRISLWSPDGGPEITLPTHYFTTALSWRPDGRSLAVGCGDGKLNLWNPASTEPIAIEAHKRRLHSLAWSPDGQWLATGGADATLRFWHADGTPGPVNVTPNSEVTAVAWSPDGQWLVSGGKDVRVRFWQRDGSFGPTFRGHLAGVHSLDWSCGGAWVVSASGDGSMRFWSADGPLREPIRGSGQNNLRVAWSPDSKRFVTGGPYRTAHVFNTDGTAVFAPQGNTLQTRHVAWSRDGRRIALGSHLMDSLYLCGADGSPGVPIQGSFGVNDISFSPDGLWMATANTDRTVRLWAHNGTAGPVLDHGNAAAISWSPDSQRLVTGGADSTLRLWNVDGTALHAVEAHAKRVEAVAWSPDGNRIASGAATVVRLWDPDGNPIAVLKGHGDDISGVAWRPDSRQLVSCSQDRTVRIWNVDGTLQHVMQGHVDTPRSVAWSPDGRWIASTGDGTVLLWDAATGEPQWVAILMDEGESVTFDVTGKILDGTPEVLDRELVYIVESASGTIETLKPSEFLQRAAAKAE